MQMEPREGGKRESETGNLKLVKMAGRGTRRRGKEKWIDGEHYSDRNQFAQHDDDNIEVYHSWYRRAPLVSSS